MKNSKKNIKRINELKEIIFNKLSPLINNDYIFLDLPYYTNIGDTLIWQGTGAFLKTLPYRCLYKAAIETYITPNISKDVVILLQGGGNFGDLWRRHTDFCLRILREFPENKAIILPQTVFYENETILKKDAQMMAKHSNLTICARDNMTHQLLSKFFFKNKILLIPDMAFYIQQTVLNKYREQALNKKLFFKRKDKECYPFNYDKYLHGQENIEEREWPSMEEDLFLSKILRFIERIHFALINIKYFNKISGRLIDWYAVNIYMPTLIKIGIKFLSSYQYIYTTRLHGAILNVLLQKPMTFFDNSYGKNSSIYNTWLKETDGIKFVERD